MGLVAGPHAHTPRTHSLWVAHPGSTPQGRAVGRGRAPNTGRTTPKATGAAPLGKASSQERALTGW